MSKNWFSDWITIIAGSHEFGTLRNALIDASTAAGFIAIAAGEVDFNDPKRSAFLINTWPADWLEFYQREKLFEVDPLFRGVREKGQNFAWSDLIFDGPGEMRLLKAARSRGWVDGLVILMPRGGERFGIVSLVSTAPVPRDEHRHQTEMLMTMAYERLRGIASGVNVIANNAGLTAREIECLSLVAQGCSDARIATSLGIAESTAHGHIELCKQKLGVKTRTQAVAISMHIGIL